jgi:hypothetical protein
MTAGKTAHSVNNNNEAIKMKKTTLLLTLITCAYLTPWQTAFASVCELDDGTKLCNETSASCAALGGQFNAEDSCKVAAPAPIVYSKYDLNGDGAVTSADISFLRMTRFGLCTPLTASYGQCLTYPFPIGRAGDVMPADGQLSTGEMYAEIFGVCIESGDALACNEAIAIFPIVKKCANGDAAACNSLIGI